MEDLHSTKQKEDSGGTPPPLPYRHDLSDNNRMKSRSSEDILQAVAQSEKSNGEIVFVKKHRRNLSHDLAKSQYSSSSGSGDLLPVSRVGGNSEGIQGPKQQRSKSQGDIMKIPGFEGPNEVFGQGSIAAAEADQAHNIKAYLEVDITEPPDTPEDMKFDPSVELELPEGWREVRNENGTYFWHVPTGTTQWERPQMVPRKKVQE